ncbi:hypothetical protein EDC19_2438 [Natranaerovirga hydrolytica]|uniref:Tetratricopeptide repeat protein n=1 Tax=Natranaerovirga hydrolytica TaxID=680378 RepID=A0A4R1MAG6_9FIRM|nr:hypothetical protein [Natranaerovirga hydrolytica]TCK89025.1 hypothetical protein EDC19_2438 [Natranaerovirga hydrolytica]
MPIILILFIIFLVVFRIKINKTSKKHLSSKEAFWQKESESNFVRKKNIDDLDYISIPVDALPFDFNTDDEDIKAIQDKITQISDLKLINLKGYSNTDIKLKYGTSNLELLSSYEDNYTRLLRSLLKWGKLLYESERIDDATKVLEYGVSIETDISEHYILLARIYKRSNKMDKIIDLIHKVDNLDSLMKEKTIETLNAFL